MGGGLAVAPFSVEGGGDGHIPGSGPSTLDAPPREAALQFYRNVKDKGPDSATSSNQHSRKLRLLRQVLHHWLTQLGRGRAGLGRGPRRAGRNEGKAMELGTLTLGDASPKRKSGADGVHHIGATTTGDAMYAEVDQSMEVNELLTGGKGVVTILKGAETAFPAGRFRCARDYELAGDPSQVALLIGCIWRWRWTVLRVPYI